jgi:hypothetical protein
MLAVALPAVKVGLPEGGFWVDNPIPHVYTGAVVEKLLVSSIFN